jgi:hypothetical protein
MEPSRDYILHVLNKKIKKESRNRNQVYDQYTTEIYPTTTPVKSISYVNLLRKKESESSIPDNSGNISTLPISPRKTLTFAPENVL